MVKWLFGKRAWIALFLIGLVINMPAAFAASFYSINATGIDGLDGKKGNALVGFSKGPNDPISYKAVVETSKGTVLNSSEVGITIYGETIWFNNTEFCASSSCELYADGPKKTSDYFECLCDSSDSLTTSNPYERIKFVYDSKRDNSIDATKEFNLYADFKPPTFTKLALSQVGSSLQLDYNVLDSACTLAACSNVCAGIKEIEISDAASVVATISINAKINECSSIGTFRFNYTTDGDLKFNVAVRDNLWTTPTDNSKHALSKSLGVTADFTKPAFGDFNITQNNHLVSWLLASGMPVDINVVVAEKDLKKIVGDFTGTGGANNVELLADKCVTTDKTICTFKNVFISKSMLNFVLVASDNNGNSFSWTFTKELKIDDGKPKITFLGTKFVQDGNSYARKSGNIFAVKIIEQGAGLKKRNVFLDLSKAGLGTEEKANKCINVTEDTWECYWEDRTINANSDFRITLISKSTDDSGNSFTNDMRSVIVKYDNLVPKNVTSIVIKAKSSDGTLFDFFREGDLLVATANMSGTGSHVQNAFMDTTDILGSDDTTILKGTCTASGDYDLCTFETAGVKSGINPYNITFYDGANNTMVYKRNLFVYGKDSAKPDNVALKLVPRENYPLNGINRLLIQLVPDYEISYAYDIKYKSNTKVLLQYPAECKIVGSTETDFFSSFISKPVLSNQHPTSKNRLYLKFTNEGEATSTADLEKISDFKLNCTIISYTAKDKNSYAEPEQDTIILPVKFRDSYLEGTPGGAVKKKIDEERSGLVAKTKWLTDLRKTIDGIVKICSIFKSVQTAVNIILPVTTAFWTISKAWAAFTPVAQGLCAVHSSAQWLVNLLYYGQYTGNSADPSACFGSTAAAAKAATSGAKVLTVSGIFTGPAMDKLNVRFFCAFFTCEFSDDWMMGSALGEAVFGNPLTGLGILKSAPKTGNQVTGKVIYSSYDDAGSTTAQANYQENSGSTNEITGMVIGNSCTSNDGTVVGKCAPQGFSSKIEYMCGTSSSCGSGETCCKPSWPSMYSGCNTNPKSFCWVSSSAPINPAKHTCSTNNICKGGYCCVPKPPEACSSGYSCYDHKLPNTACDEKTAGCDAATNQGTGSGYCCIVKWEDATTGCNGKSNNFCWNTGSLAKHTCYPSNICKGNYCCEPDPVGPCTIPNSQPPYNIGACSTTKTNNNCVGDFNCPAGISGSGFCCPISTPPTPTTIIQNSNACILDDGTKGTCTFNPPSSSDCPTECDIGLQKGKCCRTTATPECPLGKVKVGMDIAVLNSCEPLFSTNFFCCDDPIPPETTTPETTTNVPCSLNTDKETEAKNGVCSASSVCTYEDPSGSCNGQGDNNYCCPSSDVTITDSAEESKKALEEACTITEKTETENVKAGKTSATDLGGCKKDGDKYCCPSSTTFEDVNGALKNVGIDLAASVNSDPKQSLIASIGTVCIGGIVYNLEKLRQIQCQYIKCLEDTAKQGGDIAICEDTKQTAQCMYVTGQIFETFGIFKFLRAFAGQLSAFFENLIPNAFGYGAKKICEAAKPKTPEGIQQIAYDVACSYPQAIYGYIDQYQQVKNSYNSMANINQMFSAPPGDHDFCGDVGL